MLMKIIDLNEFLQHLKIKSEKYASQNKRRFAISFDDEFRTFVKGVAKLQR